MSAPRIATALAAAALGLLALAGAAQARQVHPYHYSFSIDAGGGAAKAIAFDAAGQAVLIVNGPKVHKFTAAGVPDPFADLSGADSFVPAADDSLASPSLAVDESATASAGSFYLGSSRVYGYGAGGAALAGFPLALNSFPCGAAVAPDGRLWLALNSGGGFGTYREYGAGGLPTGRSLQLNGSFGGGGGCQIGFDSAGNLYVSKLPGIEKYAPDFTDLGPLAPAGALLAVDRANDTVFTLSGDFNAAGQPTGDNLIAQYDSAGNPIVVFGGADPAHSYAGLSGAVGIAVNPQGGDLYALKPSSVDVFARDAAAVTVPDTTTAPAGGLSGTGATLHGTLSADGVATAECRFEWGSDASYGNSEPCAEGDVFGGSGDNSVSADLSGLTKGQNYHFRLVASNANGVVSYGRDRTFAAADPPQIAGTAADHITTDSARAEFSVNPQGAATTYRVEFVDDDTYREDVSDHGAGHGFDHAAREPLPDAAPAALADPDTSLDPHSLSRELTGLAAATAYHYRVVATNPSGTAAGPGHAFTTFAEPAGGTDSCPNAQARQQTGAVGLADCRAYELVSAPDTGGYDVRSTLTGDTPLPTSPGASDTALYSMSHGTIPGIAGQPTNKGADPYLASRDPGSGWSTRYVGLPAGGLFDAYAAGPFASPLLGFDDALDTFAFGGTEICDPCFADGSTDVPLRLPDGSLVEGMAGPIDPGPANPEGTPLLSADGTHFVFASKLRFVSGGWENGADVTVYDRNLRTGVTQIASTNPASGVLKNSDGVAALGVSDDGQRILIGNRVGDDAGGNPLYDLYMHVGASPFAVEVADTPGGVTYAGMSADGSQVLFTTREQLAGDTDSGADLFRATIDGGAASLERVSADPAAGPGGVGDTDACDPAANSANADWNALPGAPTDCSVVAIGGGGGVAPGTGAAYFLSPEVLDCAACANPLDHGTEGAPNLYLARPGEAPRFVATLESELSGPQPPVYTFAFQKGFGSFSRAPGVAADPASGAVYVLDIGFAGVTVKRFDSIGNPLDFGCAACSAAGSNVLDGSDAPSGAFAGNFFQFLPAQIAVDPASGKLYVPDYNHNVVDVFDADGTYDSQLAVSTPSGVAIDPTTHDVYVANRGGSQVVVFPAAGGASSSFSVAADAANPTAVAVDSAGTVYVANNSRAAVYSGGAFAGVLDPNASFGVAVDPATDDVFVNEGDKFVQFDSAGDPTGGADGEGAAVGGGVLSGSRGIALGAAGTAYTTNANSSAVIFPRLPKANPLNDSPLVIGSVADPYAPSAQNFQLTASGEHAALRSALALGGGGFDSGGAEEVFRYDAAGERLDCASCAVTGALPAGDATLAAHGSSIADSGDVFFTSGEQLVLRDSNERLDAYQYSGGAQQLVSTGIDSHDSVLLSVSADGADAFFFTREKLVPEDRNGDAVRLYDARAGGGFAFGPPEFQCKASDECHGPGTEAQEPGRVGTIAGTPGQFEPEQSGKKSACDPSKASQRARRFAAKAKALRSRARRLAARGARRAARRARRNARIFAAGAKRNRTAAKRCRARAANAKRRAAR